MVRFPGLNLRFLADTWCCVARINSPWLMLFYEQARTEGENWTGISAMKGYNGTKGEKGFTSLQWQLGRWEVTYPWFISDWLHLGKMGRRKIVELNKSRGSHKWEKKRNLILHRNLEFSTGRLLQSHHARTKAWGAAGSITEAPKRNLRWWNANSTRQLSTRDGGHTAVED